MKKGNITHLLFPVELNMFLVMPSKYKTKWRNVKEKISNYPKWK